MYWVCGEEPVLRSLVTDQIVAMYGALPYNTFRLSAREIPESEIWAHLNQHPLDSEQKRLLVVTDAERLEQPIRLEGWLAENQRTRNKNVCAIFVADEPDLTSPLYKVLNASSSAVYVRCTLPKAPEDREKRAVDMICSWGRINPINARVLYEHVGGDLYEARAVMQKAGFFPEAEVNVGAIRVLAQPRVQDEIVWNLISGRRKAAADALAAGTDVPVGKVLATLAAHLEYLGRLYDLMSLPTFSIADAARRLDIRQQYVRLLSPHARLYPANEVTRRLYLLARLDHLYQQGARDGILEAVVAGW